MSGSNLIRWAGLANIVFGVLLAVGSIIHPPDDTAAAMSTGLWATAHVLVELSLLFGILGLFGLYARQTEESGALGLVGFLLVFLTLASFLSVTFFEAFIIPVMVREAPEFIESLLAFEISGGAMDVILPASGILFILGWVLFGIGIIRAGILSRWAAIVAIVGAVPFGLFQVLPEIVGLIAAVVFGLGLVWLGYALWSEKPAMAAAPAI